MLHEQTMRCHFNVLKVLRLKKPQNTVFLFVFLFLLLHSRCRVILRQAYLVQKDVRNPFTLYFFDVRRALVYVDVAFTALKRLHRQQYRVCEVNL